MKILLSLAGSKPATYFRSLGLADGVHCSYGVGTRRAGAILQVHALDTFTGLPKRFFRTQW